MTKLGRLALPISVALAISLPHVSSAGGWWSLIHLQRSYAAPGQHVRAATQFLFDSLETAAEARRQGGFRAYLIAGFDFDVVNRAMGKASPGEWWSLGAGAPLEVGMVRLSRWDGNLATASVEFGVPALDPGKYALMFCDVGCAHPLGDIVPVTLTVVRDPMTAGLAARLGRLEDGTAVREARLRARLRAVSQEAAAAAAPDIQGLWSAIGAVDRRLVRLEQRNPAPWWTWAGWCLAAAALGFALAMGVTGGRRRLSGAVEGPSTNGHDRRSRHRRAVEPAESRGAAPYM